MSKLTNKTYKEYSYISRYAYFPYYYHNSDNKYLYGLTAYLNNTTSYTLHVVQQGETIDSLALDYYGNPTLYWIICSFNHIQNPFKELVVGEQLKIPSISNLIYNKDGRN